MYWDVELTRLLKAELALGDLIARHWIPDANLSPAALGQALWREETRGSEIDDRRLYWRRLAMLSTLDDPGEQEIFEHASRGFADLAFNEPDTRHVLVTGFDPFHLDDHIDQGNPSGHIALALDNRLFNTQRGSARVKTCVVPVRYADFDNRLIELLLEPVMPKLDMLITISMGRSGFDLERFPGRRRSVTTEDNARLEGGGTPDHPSIPPDLVGAEFVEFTLPVEEMLSVQGPFDINDNRTISTLENGEVEASSLAELAGKTAVQGSGGGYLSNEISYRALRFLQDHGEVIPAGHIHTPRMSGYDKVQMNGIVDQCIDLVAAAIATLD